MWRRTGFWALGGMAALLLVARPAAADCMADFLRAAAAQIGDLDNQEKTPFRSVTSRIDSKTGRVVSTLTTVHAPPDRTRTTQRVGDTVEETVTTADRLWVGHGGALQEVPTTIARERIDAAHASLLAYRAQLAAADWHKRAQGLTCTPDATLDGRPAEYFTFTDAETGMPTKLYTDPKTAEPLRTEAAGQGFTVVQTIERDPGIHIDLPATPG